MPGSGKKASRYPPARQVLLSSWATNASFTEQFCQVRIAQHG
jgi:hypothetical protein